MTLALHTPPPKLDALMNVARRPDAVFTHGHGSWLHDSQGRRYLDLVQGWAVNTLGHAPPQIAAALAAQSQRLLQPGPGFFNDRAAELASRLAALSGLDRVFFTSSGAEANEGAIKLARKFGQVHRGGAHEIVTFENAFHGRTLATMSASGKPGFDRLFAPQVPGFPKARLNDLDSVRALIGPQTVAVMLEPIQGEAGVIEATPGFMQALRALCDERGLLLILDEVQTGVGRTGTLWGFEAAGVKPDVMTLGKGLGGGVPIGALLAREAVCCFEPGDQGGTYCGNPLMCAVALAVLDAVTGAGFLDAVAARSAQLREGLDAIARRLGSPPVVGRGLLLALELPGDDAATRLASTLIARADEAEPGLLVNAVRPRRLRFMPALNVEAAELASALAMLDAAVS
ncbi:aminotransferase class III-fold pyridoxal phosphate-dependent enzyme [Caldimonas sp. KR1-144]|uniref:aminotransferase class III-fold pyridoxal phosphate-dependent enzyme n=1 Tax=Caldimonas sp. KR1-144 TaxID=3400911 RepID=UPI003C079113